MVNRAEFDAMKDLEEIAFGFSGVQKAYAIQAVPKKHLA